jgi:hypothetical protein
MLWIWFLRLLSGERFRKATPAEQRFFSAYFLFIPIFGGLFVKVGIAFMKTTGFVSNWLFATALGVVLIFGSYYWGKFMPAKISWILGGIIWAIVIGLALSGRL